MAKEAFAFKCPSCGAMLAAKLSWVGKRVRCNKCNEVVTVPAPAEKPAAGAGEGAVEAAGEPAAEAPAAPEAAGTRDETAFAPGGALLNTISRWLSEGVGEGFSHFSSLFPAALIFAVLNLEGLLLGGLPIVFLTPAITLGLVLLMVNIARGARPRPWTLFEPFVNGGYWRSVGVFWLFAAVVAAACLPACALSGAAHLIALPFGVPARILAWLITVCAALGVLYLVSRVIWAPPLVIDRGMRVTESFRESWKMTGRVGRGWGVFLLLVILRIIGAAVCIVIAGVSYAAFLGVGNLVSGAPAATPEAGEVFTVEAMAALFSAFSVGAAVAVVVFVLLASTALVILAMPIFIGYRESVPH